MSTPAASVPTPEPQALSEGARIINTFIDPKKTFSDIRRKASWWAPWLLIAVFSYLFVGVAAQKIGFDQIVQNQIRMNPKQAEQLEKAPPEKRQQALDFSVTLTKGISYAIPIVNLILFAIIAGVLMGAFNFGLGAEITFGQALAVVIYSWLPSVVKVVLAVISIYAGADPQGFNFEYPVASHLGALVDMSAHPALFVFLAAFDIFAIWILVLQGIGFSSISKVKTGKAMAVVFGLYAVVVLVKVGFAAAFS